MYYIMLHTTDDCTNIEFKSESPLIDYKLLAKNRIEKKLPKIELIVPKDCVLWDYYKIGSYSFISEKLKLVFESLKINAQYFLVHCEYPFDKNDKYYYLHLLEKHECFDFENSIYSKFGVMVKDIKKLAIKTDYIESDLFHIPTCGNTIYFASSHVKMKMEENNIEGVAFLDFSSWCIRHKTGW